MNLPGLMIAISVSSGVLLISVSLLQLAREDFLHHHQATALDDSVAYGLQIIDRTVKQATRDRSLSPPAQSSGSLPFDPAHGPVQGIDNARISGTGTTVSPGINGSDVLIIQLGSAWGEVIDCAGFVIPKASTASTDSGWVMFYIASGPDGEPELYCRYQGQKQWDAQAIVSGVECFQVLLGLDDDGDGLPNQFLSASAIKQQADQAAGDGSSVRRVVAVQVALVLRSAVSGSKPPFFPTADLFGHTYTQTNSATDVGTAHCPVSLSASLSSRARRRVESIIFSSDRASLK